MNFSKKDKLVPCINFNAFWLCKYSPFFFILTLSLFASITINSPETTMLIGNRFWGNYLTEDVRGNIGQDVSIRFTVYKTGNIQKFEWYKMWGVEPGIPDVEPKFRIGIQEDLHGSPSNVWLGYKDLGGVSPLSGGWTIVEFASAIPVVSGEVYHARIQILQHYSKPEVSIVLEGFRAGGYFGAPECTFIRPKTQIADTMMALMRWDYIQQAWIPFLQTPSFVIVYDDGTSEGQPYNNIFYFRIGKTSSEVYAYAQRFAVLETIQVQHLTAWIIKRGNPADNLYLSVYDETDQKYLAQNLVAMKKTDSEDGKWITLSAQQKTTLEPHVYRLEWRSPNTLKDQDTYWINTYANYATLPEIFATAYYNGFLISKNNGNSWESFYTGIYDSTFFLH